MNSTLASCGHRPHFALLATCVVVTSGACFDEPTFNAPPDTSNAIFFDGFAEGVDFQAFAGTNQANPDAQAMVVDATEHHSGRTSLRVTVPGVGDPAGAFAGGAFISGQPRNLSKYNALQMFVKGSRAATVDVLGFGNDNTGDLTFNTERHKVAIGADWTEVVIPMPDPSKLTSQRGLFHFAEGADGTPPTGYTLWFDDIQFITLDAASLGAAQPTIGAADLPLEVDSDGTVADTAVHFSARPAEEVVLAAPAYFAFTSSDTAVATVNDAGSIHAVAPGKSDVTATLAGVAATGTVHVTVSLSRKPTTPAPTPTQAAADVISLYSDAYPSVPVDTFRADYSLAGALKDETIGTDHVKHYAAVNFVGIEFIQHELDVTGMTTFHIDIFTPDSTVVRVKLVDFGANGAFQGGDDSEQELAFQAGTNPPLVVGDWMSLDLPLSVFTGLHGRAHVAQLILSGSTSELYVDNIYFHR